MKRIHPEISNLDMPVAVTIKQWLDNLAPTAKQKLLTDFSEPDFISQRVDIYLDEIEHAVQAGYDELGAKELALAACLHEIPTGNE